MNKVIFVVGPTASGKTDLSIKLAKEIGGEIVSADSMQIYKGIHIASAGPDIEEMCGIPHHLIEFLDLNEQFSVADYVIIARKKIKEIISRGNIPIVVGGTGLYISALIENTEFVSVGTDETLRKKLEEEFDTLGGEEMLNRLAKFDPQSAERLNAGDKRRIVRCFEIFETTGKSLTQQNELSHRNPPEFESLVLGITYKDREKLYDRINRRVDIMLQKGLLEEAKTTYKNRNNKGAFQVIGHKELYGYFDGEHSLEEAAELLKQQTRRYAKRQLAWFRKNENIIWLYPYGDDDIFKTAKALAEEFLN